MSRGRDWVQSSLDHLIWFIILVVFVYFATTLDGFLSSRNMINILMHASVLGLITVGQAICLFTGHFDLSSEGTAALVAMVAAWLMVPRTAVSVVTGGEFGAGLELHPLIVIPIILLLGLGIGWFNGFVIGRVRMNAFIVTLAMQLVLYGMAFVISAGNTIANLPAPFLWLGSGRLGPIPVQLIATAIAFIGFDYVVRRSGLGRKLLAVGGNRDAARASGFSVKGTIMRAYMISGILGAAAGWMEAGRIGEATWNIGSGMGLESIAAAVIGGVALRGGAGSVAGAFAGVLLLSVVDNGLNLMHVNPYWVKGIRGLIILVALVIQAQRYRYRLPGVRLRTTTDDI